MRNMHIHPSDAPFENGMVMANNVFQRNICYYTDPNSKLFRLRNVHFDHNDWDYNLYWHGGLPLSIPRDKVATEDEWDSWLKMGKDKHSLVADPKFVDADAGDYRLRPDSPAFALGFKPIPMDKIGPYEDDLRASWPIREVRGAKDWLKVDWSAPKPRVAPPRDTTPFTAEKRATVVTIDGTLSAGEWPAATMTLKQTPNRDPISGPTCSARAAHDGTTLYIALTVPVADSNAIARGSDWGMCDGAEVCFQDASKPDGPIFVIHGFASGQTKSVTDAGAPKAAASQLGKATRFAATIDAKQWTGEWAIPLAAAGITPSPGLRLSFNIGVRRTSTDEWIIRTGSLGASWKLHNAGFLLLE